MNVDRRGRELAGFAKNAEGRMGNEIPAALITSFPLSGISGLNYLRAGGGERIGGIYGLTICSIIRIFFRMSSWP